MSNEIPEELKEFDPEVVRKIEYEITDAFEYAKTSILPRYKKQPMTVGLLQKIEREVNEYCKENDYEIYCSARPNKFWVDLAFHRLISKLNITEVKFSD